MLDKILSLVRASVSVILYCVFIKLVYLLFFRLRSPISSGGSFVVYDWGGSRLAHGLLTRRGTGIHCSRG